MNFSSICTYEHIQNYSNYNTTSQCQFIDIYCHDEPEDISFLSLYFCWINQDIFPMIILSSAFIYLAFKFISSTAEDNLEPALSRCAKHFNISESLSGVTLLAFANGCPDIIASFTAAESIDAIHITIGGLFGAGLFTTSIVLSACLLGAKKIQAHAPAMIRDVGFYLIGVIYMLIWAIIGEITVVSCIGFFVLYLIFVGFVLNHERLQRRQRNELQESLNPGSQSFSISTNTSALVDQNSFSISGNTSNTQANSSIFPHHLFIEETSKNDNNPKNAVSVDNIKDNITFRKKTSIIAQIFHILARSLSALVNYPSHIVRLLTIPCLDDDKWNKKISIAQPFTTTFFLVFCFGLFDVFLSQVWPLIILSLICTIFSLYIWYTCDNESVPVKLIPLYSIVAFIVSCAWIHLVSGLMMDFLEYINVMSSLPMNFIALTLLAWGNSMNDFFVDVALAKKGMGITAISGIFAGQFFNLQIGFGISMMRQIMLKGELQFNLLTEDTDSIVNIILMVGLGINLSVILMYGIRSKFILKSKFSIYLILFYLSLFIIVALLTLHYVVSP